MNFYAFFVVLAFVASSNQFISTFLPSGIAALAFTLVAIIFRLETYIRGVLPSIALLYSSVIFFFLISGLLGFTFAPETSTLKGLLVLLIYPVSAFLALLPASNLDVMQMTIYFWRYAQMNILGAFISILWQLSGHSHLTVITTYRSLFFFPVSFSDAAIGLGDLYRPAGFFDEPATLAMFYLFVFALISSQGLWKYLYNAKLFLLLSASCFSAAYFVSLVVGYLFCKFTLFGRKILGRPVVKVSFLKRLGILGASLFATFSTAEEFLSTVYQKLQDLFDNDNSRLFINSYSFPFFANLSCFDDAGLCSSLYNAYQPFYYLNSYGLLGSASVIIVFSFLLYCGAKTKNIFCFSIIIFFLQRSNLFASYPSILLAVLIASLYLGRRDIDSPMLVQQS